MKKDNKVDKAINEVLESERMQQAGSFIKKAIFIGIGLLALAIIIAILDNSGVI